MTAFQIETNPEERRIVDTLKAKLDGLNFRRGSQAEGIALRRIGLLVKNAAKRNIRKNNQVDSGALGRSITSETTRKRDSLQISIAPRGIPYAAINEFGRVFTSRMRRAMFRHFKETGRLGRGVDKNVIVGGKNTKIYRARPYLRPALTENRARIMDIIREAWRE